MLQLGVGGGAKCYIFLSCVWHFIGAKSAPNNRLVSEKKYIVFFVLIGVGGVRLFFLFFFKAPLIATFSLLLILLLLLVSPVANTKMIFNGH